MYLSLMCVFSGGICGSGLLFVMLCFYVYVSDVLMCSGVIGCYDMLVLLFMICVLMLVVCVVGFIMLVV